MSERDEEPGSVPPAATAGGAASPGAPETTHEADADPEKSGSASARAESDGADLEKRPDGKANATAANPRRPRSRWLTAAVFLLPALLVLGALVAYPIIYTILRSLYDRSGDSFVGIDNYQEMFERSGTRRAIRNNIIWVVFAPTIASILGLIFAVLAERVRWQTVFKVAVFMPMAVSFLAAGVIFRLVYETEPERGLANAIITGTADLVRDPVEYRGARPSDAEQLEAAGSAYTTADTFSPGDSVALGLVGLPPDRVPESAEAAAEPESVPDDAISGTVWLDFTRGGGGARGEIDSSEQGLPGVKVEVLSSEGRVAGRATADERGLFTVDGLEPGEYQVRLAASNFREPFEGFNWLGPDLVTAATISAFLWIWAGFAMIVIGSGLAAIPREVLEAARVDGANEWKVFRRVTVPLLMPVLLVVIVTLVINVLKIFDLVFVIPPPSVQDDANVIALEMWRVSFGGARDEGLGSALSVLLFVLVIPAMAFNIKRFRSEG